MGAISSLTFNKDDNTKIKLIISFEEDIALGNYIIIFNT